MREIHIGRKYRHFKGMEYEVFTVADHSETGGVWARKAAAGLLEVKQPCSPTAQLLLSKTSGLRKEKKKLKP